MRGLEDCRGARLSTTTSHHLKSTEDIGQCGKRLQNRVATGGKAVERVVHVRFTAALWMAWTLRISNICFLRCVWSVLPADIWNSSIKTVSHGIARMIGGASQGDDDPYVKYGDIIFLQHVRSGSQLMVDSNNHSDFEPNCFVVDLGIENRTRVEDRCFRIVPKYSIRQEREHVRIKDQVHCLYRLAAFPYPIPPMSHSGQNH